MRRVLFASWPLCLLLLGCPGGSSQPAPPSSQPALDPGAPGGGETATPGSAAPAPPPQKDMMDELAELGPRMTFDLAPAAAISSGKIMVVLERVAMLARTAENLAKEPWDAKSEVAPQGHYLTLTLRVTVDGKPWTELPPGEQVGAIGPLVVQFEDEPVPLESGTFEALPDRPESAYHWRRFVPPAHKDGELTLTLAIQLEGQEPVWFEFPALRPLGPKKAPEAGKPPEEPAKPPEAQKPPEEPKPPEAPNPGETGEEEH